MQDSSSARVCMCGRVYIHPRRWCAVGVSAVSVRASLSREGGAGLGTVVFAAHRSRLILFPHPAEDGRRGRDLPLCTG